jgi:histidinol-phosphatase
MNPEWRSRYEIALGAAREAGQFALGHFDSGVAVEWKEDRSPVTLADRGAEQLLRTRLLAAFPGDGFLGEESGALAGVSGYRWIIDPIDGTRNFVRGIPLWATLVGLEYKGEAVCGVTFLPALAQTYRALRGDGAFRDDRPIRVSTVANLRQAHLFYSSVGWFTKAGCEAQFLRLIKQTERQRGFGDFYGFVLVAQGSGDLMVEHGVHSWDLAALVPLIEEAGGKITAWNGVLDIDRPDVLASNGLVHEAALAILNDRAAS